MLWPGFGGQGAPVMFISGFSTNLIGVGREMTRSLSR